MSKILVAYFSATGTTADAAKRLADAVKGDLFEIRPAVPYTAADLDWTDKHSRSTLEMKDPASRPEVSSHVDNMDQYDTVFVGFPIWWYVAPTIINTFLDEYDFSGKTVIPFATSGGSGMGKTLEEKSLGCIHKGGHSPINAVYDYAKQVESKQGLVIMDTPGNDPSSVAAMVAGGAQVVVFSSGRGTPTGNPIAPVIKLTGNKLTQKYYRTHSGYAGGLKETRYDRLMATRPTLAMTLAVRGMLAKNPTQKWQLRRLKVFAGNEHKHAAQKPEAWTLG